MTFLHMLAGDPVHLRKTAGGGQDSFFSPSSFQLPLTLLEPGTTWLYSLRAKGTQSNTIDTAGISRVCEYLKLVYSLMNHF